MDTEYKIIMKTPKGLCLEYMVFDNRFDADKVLDYLEVVQDEGHLLDGWEVWGEKCLN